MMWYILPELILMLALLPCFFSNAISPMVNTFWPKCSGYLHYSFGSIKMSWIPAFSMRLFTHASSDLRWYTIKWKLGFPIQHPVFVLILTAKQIQINTFAGIGLGFIYNGSLSNWNIMLKAFVIVTISNKEYPCLFISYIVHLYNK